MSMRGPVFTLRGLAILGFVAYLLNSPVRNDADIVASVMSFSLLGIVLALAIATLVNGWKLYSLMTIHLSSSTGHAGNNLAMDPAAGSAPVSGASYPFVLAVENAHFLPFFQVTVRLLFEQGKVERRVHVITGKQSPGKTGTRRLLRENLLFPHRGVWRCYGVKCTFGDQFGLTRISWIRTDSASKAVFNVHPPKAYTSHLPVLSSSKRPGDLLTDTQQRLGDPYDLKRYHPSDGMKKILWKIYARTGELISRHPERSMNPEGFVLLHVIANKLDDDVCSAAVAYTEKLKDMGLDFLLSCEGMGGLDCASTPEGVEELLVKSVWDTINSTGAKLSLATDLRSLITATRERSKDITIDQVLILSSQRRLGKMGDSEAKQVVEPLLIENIVPVFCVLPEPIALRLLRKTDGTTQNSSNSRLSKLLLEPDAGSEHLYVEDDSRYQVFLDVCARHQWQVILDQPG
jgi:hypothetical protein